MLTFCPNCSNLLFVTRGEDSCNRFECKTCPYELPILPNMHVFDRKKMNRKVVDDVLGGEGAWDNVDQTPAQCPKEGCDGEKAYFFQLQIRSADEPMTTFYKCTSCGNQWREN
ncbi:DNA-directed RNA polymerases III 12.5 kDa polypeptide [Nadsonia fulvescens var. elongata DSM 6958]|uniref:DNA-directed RNA polymerase subunit n=1 Tax=Nadsonia fulvescens var. elongata DSM 6958 TaxID=857566 RepID=A0A1E3PEJ2_9ASCO|nr:DNA-directed RNA polymerases III 12.5 kDa polypeptide [Nadsonia fulvescens var. elongata DSM 6958]